MSGWFWQALPSCVCLIALPGLAHLANDHWLGIAALFALLFGCLLLGAALFDRNVVWIITSGEILIGEQRPLREAAPKIDQG